MHAYKQTHMYVCERMETYIREHFSYVTCTQKHLISCERDFQQKYITFTSSCDKEISKHTNKRMPACMCVYLYKEEKLRIIWIFCILDTKMKMI